MIDESDSKARRARSFGPVAELYDRVRPGYPPEAIEWLLPSGASRVVEIGAGTGALTRSLVALGLEVTAVEPDAEMRRVLQLRLPHADVRAGRAEEIPVEDGEADAVVGGQMWHWVDIPPASSEVARVLKSGGMFGLVWNLRDERVQWVAELGVLLGGEDEHSRRPEVMFSDGAPFAQESTADFASVHELAPGDLVDLAASRSRVQVLDAGERSELLARVEEFSRSRPELQAAERVAIPYVTSCWRAVRL